MTWFALIPFLAFAQPKKCPDIRASEISVVNIAFDYPDGLSLKGSTHQDIQFYDDFAQNFANGSNIKKLTEFDASETKEKFLAKLKSSVGSGPYLNLNYSGHSVLLPNGQAAWLLPGIPMNQEQKQCFTIYSNPRLVSTLNQPNNIYSKMCPRALDPYLVTAQDIQKAVPGKKIFGVLDTCFAEGFNLGPNSSMIYSSSKTQPAENGAISFSQLISSRGRGANLKGPDGKMTFARFGEFAKANGGTPLQTPSFKPASWAECLTFSDVKCQFCGVQYDVSEELARPIPRPSQTSK